MSKYGLQLRVKPSDQKKPPPTRPPLRPPAGFFNDDDDNDIEREISRQASKNKALRDIEQQHKKALEEDPSVFDYDGVYDDMKEKAVKPLVIDRQERKPRYIQAIMNTTKVRARETEIAYERKLAKERSKEDHLFEGKEKFVTSAYKKKLAEQAKWLEEDRLRQLREEKEDISKKGDMTDFYFNLSKNVAFGATEAEPKKKKHEKPIEEEKVDTSAARSPPSPSAHIYSSIVQQRHESETSVQPNQISESVEAAPGSKSSAQEKVATEQVKEQPTVDNHKRNVDALAAAKERYLARKKSKEQ